MIVKVQVPLASNDPFAPALVYAEGRTHMRTIHLDDLPRKVLDAASQNGKAFFYAQMAGGRMRFHNRAPEQSW